jgi:hypothetical protein
LKSLGKSCLETPRLLFTLGDAEIFRFRGIHSKPPLAP